MSLEAERRLSVVPGDSDSNGDDGVSICHQKLRVLVVPGDSEGDAIEGASMCHHKLRVGHL